MSSPSAAIRPMPKRVLSVVCLDWSMTRFSRHEGAKASDLSRFPFALVAALGGGKRITAANEVAAAQGVTCGQLLTDALALVPGLAVADADPEADRRALRRLAGWCARYSPWVAFDPNGRFDEADGLLLDITGCAHLFGGEEALVRDLLDRFAALHINAQAGIASTVGAAWALARFATPPAGFRILASGDEENLLRPLPLAALRLAEEQREMLARVGLKSIADLMGQPRAPFAARFGAGMLRRLDQALGREPEPISPELPHIPFRTRLRYAEGLVLIDHILQAIGQLGEDLCTLLSKEQQGARRLDLCLFRVDGEVTRLTVGTSMPTRDPHHMARLFRDRLEGVRDDFDAGFGIDVLSLAAWQTEPLRGRQARMPSEGDGQARSPSIEEAGTLVDRLSTRLGQKRVVRLCARQSHIPERSEGERPALTMPWMPEDLAGSAENAAWASTLYRRLGRPVALLDEPEVIEAIAEVPDGPPRCFIWRRVGFRVTQSEGPERISPEWRKREELVSQNRKFGTITGATRDYYKVVDEHGRRFWIFRAGLYDRLETIGLGGREPSKNGEPVPRWFLHGLFG